MNSNMSYPSCSSATEFRHQALLVVEYVLINFDSLNIHHEQENSDTIEKSKNISSLGRQDLVTQFFVKITFLYKLVAKKLDFVLSKLQISI